VTTVNKPATKAVTPGQQIKAQVAGITCAFEGMVGRPGSVRFGTKRFDIVVQEVRLARVTSLPLTPDKRERDGKAYTPPMLEVVCDVGSFLFVLEDTRFVLGLRGPVGHVADFGTVTFEVTS
jgi:hypothetical protein